MGKAVTIRQNIFRQIFEESISVKISPRQNFALYANTVLLLLIAFHWHQVKFTML